MFYQEKEFIEKFKQLFSRCNEIVLQIYNHESFDVQGKGDGSPLTKADLECNKEICSFLESLNTSENILIISEENKSIDYETRKQYDWCWLIDPIDGTKEFIKRNGEFTINVGLSYCGIPVFGMVSIPVTNELFYGIQGVGSFYLHPEKGLNKLECLSLEDKLKKSCSNIVASKSHMSVETERFISTFSNVNLLSKGSSIKLLLIANKEADIYPRIAPTSEWDTCAAHSVILYAGGHVYEFDASLDLKEYQEKGKPLIYNKENLLNPHFICF